MEEMQQNNGHNDVDNQVHIGNYSLSGILPESPLESQNRRKRYLDAYLQKAKSMIERMSSYECPVNIMDEFSIIVRETRELLFTDIIGMDGPFVNMTKYLTTQKLHLDSIRRKTPSISMYYEQVSTLIVMVVLFYIEEGLKYLEVMEQKNGTVMSYDPIAEKRRNKVMQRVWNSIECLDTYDMSYQFKYDRYDKIRAELKSKCSSYSVDVRTKEQVKKDSITSAANETAGCVLQIAIPIIIVLVLAMIFAN